MPYRGGVELRRETLRALVDRLIPTDEYASGWDAGAGEFLDRVLAGDRAGVAATVADGLERLDAEAVARYGTPYAELPEPEQDAVLDDLAVGQHQNPWPGSAEFVRLMSGLAAQGFYGDPGNGGNADAVSWRMIGYRQEPAAGSWPAPRDQPLQVTPITEVAESYDAIVIGSGAGGGVAACVMAEAGWRVLVVERGSLLGVADLRLDHLRAERAPWGYDRPTAAPSKGAPRVVATAGGDAIVDPTDSRWSDNAFTVGGGTRVYGAQAWRFAPEDFRMASVYGVPEGSSLADWPIGYDDLEPFYDRAEWELGVSGDPGGDSAAGPRTRGFPMPPLPTTAGGEVLLAGARALALRTGPVPLLVNSMEYGGRPACAQCGACIGFGCPSGSKNGSHNTVLPRALATGRCDLLVDTQVTRISTDADGRVDGVVLAARAVKAARVVVAAGAIESARLLLNSATDNEPHGLGNAHDQVGRHLQAHVYAGAIGLLDDDTQDCVGPGPSIATNDFRHGNEGIVGGAMLANDFVPTPVLAWETLTGIGAVPPYGGAGKRGMRDLYRRLLLVFGPVQEVPNPGSRVTVDAGVRDAHGVPVARLSGDIHAADRATARFVAERAAEWLRASGAREVVAINADDRPAGPSGGQHQAGTLRMGDDPTTSVTDSWGRVWGHDNLLVADGSVHVTNGGVNPVLTIMALAYRNSEHFVRAGLSGS
ncbi:GMC family oxidoreductase [Acidothermaceae bacterium B102]|nr:GMC family oxidoreductase [Acidothermaceae bacterium B102]